MRRDCPQGLDVAFQNTTGSSTPGEPLDVSGLEIWRAHLTVAGFHSNGYLAEPLTPLGPDRVCVADAQIVEGEWGASSKSVHDKWVRPS